MPVELESGEATDYLAAAARLGGVYVVMHCGCDGDRGSRGFGHCRLPSAEHYLMYRGHEFLCSKALNNILLYFWFALCNCTNTVMNKYRPFY